MGTIEEGINYQKPWEKRIWEKLRREKVLILALLLLSVLGFALLKTPPGSAARNPELPPTIELYAQLEANPHADGLKLARIEAEVINKQREPVFSASITASYGPYSNSREINLPAYFDETGRVTGRKTTVEFYLCSPDRYKEAQKVSYLKQEAREKCLLFDGTATELKITLSKENEILAQKTLKLK